MGLGLRATDTKGKSGVESVEAWSNTVGFGLFMG